MGSTNVYYNEPEACNNYHIVDQDLIYENFIMHVDVSQSDITEDIINNTLLIELRDQDDETLISVYGDHRELSKYSIYNDTSATIDISATAQNKIYLGDTINLDVTTKFTQAEVTNNSILVNDTKYFNSRMGIKISIVDSYGNQLNSDSLLGVNFTYDGVTYYPRVDGTVRIKVADRVSNALSKIKINTKNNTTIATGTYTIKVESFGSPDGIYYGMDVSDSTELSITIINGAYGLKATTDENSKIIDKTTGKTLNGNNSLIPKIEYSSSLSNPKIMATLQRRDYTSEYSLSYNDVDLKDYISNTLTEGTKQYEYLLIDGPVSQNQIFLMLKENLVTGTYKLIFKLYDGNNYIGEAYEYFIVQ